MCALSYRKNIPPQLFQWKLQGFNAPGIQNEVHTLHITDSIWTNLEDKREVLAKNYLSVSSSSVPGEQMFSTCGLLLNAKRMSMAPFRANIVSVIHDNYPKFFPVTRTAAAPAAESGRH
jgi:hypothetical protein